LRDRSSRPAVCPKQTDPQVKDLVEYLRRNMKLGPVMLVAELADFGVTLHASTVHRILLRRGISRLADLDVTGEDMRQNKNRYEHPLAGDLVHLDVKKVGRIPDGGGWRVHGKGSTGHKASKRRPRIGYCYLHTAIDGHSRLAYTEALGDEKRSQHQLSGSGRKCSSPPTASSRYTGCSPTTDPATARKSSTPRSATG